MEIRKVYVNDKDEATIICTSCGRKKVTSTSRFKSLNDPVKVKCSCGFCFAVSFEKRKHYRKNVELPGSYETIDPPHESGDILVVDISRTGVGFKMTGRRQLAVDSVIKVVFALDDAHRTQITKNVVIRRVSGNLVGAEFCDKQIHKALAFYLMP